MSKMFKRFSRKISSTSSEKTTKSQTAEVDSNSFGLKELAPGINPVLDIVAVHGLNGHRDKSWMADNGVNWLKDLLPEQNQNARIFSYGYDARTHGFVSQQHLHDHGMALVADLSLQRRATKTERRPIIFIAHSLGGIICKSALIHASATSEVHLKAHKDIHLSTYGILFFGTPHQGGNGVALGKFLVNVASTVIDTNKKILKHLEMHSEMLEQQTAQYNAISDQFETKFFYETYETSTPFGSKLVVPKYSAVIPGATNAEEIAINRNHTEMVKFRSPQDEGFRKTSLILTLMEAEAVPRISNNWRKYEVQNGLEPSKAFNSPPESARHSISDERLLDKVNKMRHEFPEVPTAEPNYNRMGS